MHTRTDPLRILLWYWGRRGGGAHYTAGLAEALAARTDVVVEASVSSSLESLERLRGAVPRVDALPVHEGVPGSLRSLPAVASHAKRMRADVVLQTMVHPFSPAGLAGLRLARIPLVTVIHDGRPHAGDRHPAMDVSSWLCARFSARVVAPSDAVAAELRARRRVAPVEVVPLGPHLVLPDSFDPAGPVVFFGRLRAYKGLDLLADAWSRVPDKVRSSVPLHVVGEGDPQDPALVRLRSMGAVVRVGWVPDAEVGDVLRGARLVVVPYREASQSGVVTIAEAARVPVLATDVGGLRAQVLAGAGVLAAPEPAAMGSVLTRLLASPQELEELHAALAATPDAAATWAPLAEQVVQLLRAAGSAVRQR